MKFKYIVVYENNSDKFDIGHYQVKVQTVSHLPHYKLLGPVTQLWCKLWCVILLPSISLAPIWIASVWDDTKLGSLYVHLRLIYNIHVLEYYLA